MEELKRLDRYTPSLLGRSTVEKMPREKSFVDI
jgi:hypothetical protein